MGLLDGKVAIVTGAGHGIGRGHALELAKHGAKVVVNDLGGSLRGEGAGRDADQTVSLVEKRGGIAVPNYADVSDHDACGELIQQAVDTFGRLDILVNNAGIVRDAVIWNMPRSDFDAVIEVHLKGTWSTCHHASKYWRAAAKAGEPVAGRIVNTTSGAGLGGNFGQSS
nr:SDR family NAD(P)-dependent oxidoreductase [Micromonospora sp. DSM 115978]